MPTGAAALEISVVVACGARSSFIIQANWVPKRLDVLHRHTAPPCSMLLYSSQPGNRKSPKVYQLVHEY